MAAHEKPSAVEKVSCKVCLKEIPKSEAKVAEATDYVLYFCGIECYTKWRTGKPGQRGRAAGN